MRRYTRSRLAWDQRAGTRLKAKGIWFLGQPSGADVLTGFLLAGTEPSLSRGAKNEMLNGQITTPRGPSGRDQPTNRRMRMAGKLALTMAATVIVGVLALGAPAPAQQAGVAVGVLTCRVSSGWGFIFGSSRDLMCTYSPKPGVAEHYSGKIQKFGADVGYVSSAVIVWGVIAPTSDLAPGALAGTYVGATGSASVGVGVGANVLVGGFKNSVTLQPVSFEGNQGLNVAAGIGAIQLTFHH
jgi:hypothetical protein